MMAMGCWSDDPRTELPQWEPEPLHLPIDEPSEAERRWRGNRNPSGDDQEGVPGSHVIVIDLA